MLNIYYSYFILNKYLKLKNLIKNLFYVDGDSIEQMLCNFEDKYKFALFTTEGYELLCKLLIIRDDVVNNTGIKKITYSIYTDYYTTYKIIKKTIKQFYLNYKNVFDNHLNFCKYDDIKEEKDYKVTDDDFEDFDKEFEISQKVEHHVVEEVELSLTNEAPEGYDTNENYTYE